MAWTQPKTWEDGQKITEGELNQQVRDNELWLKENIELGTDEVLEISNGSITITKSFHTVDTEDEAGEDELDTILGADVGRILIIHSASADRIIMLKDAIGNLVLGTDLVLDSPDVYLVLIYDSQGKWHPLFMSASY